MRYIISRPDEFLAITGLGIKSVRITKASWIWPLQRCMRFSVQPRDYAMDMQAMTKEKLQFALPVVFTVGPDILGRREKRFENVNETKHDTEDPVDDALVKYAMLLAQTEGDRELSGDHVSKIVKGIIEGETRVLVSEMTMEEIFNKREEFKRRIFVNIQSELDQFGLKIYNSNVKELKDAPDSNYFESLSQKAHEGASNQARIDVAEARLRGNVGESLRRGEEEREIAKIQAETAVKKTDRDVERAQAIARLNTKKALFDRDVEMTRAEAKRALESRDEDLKKEVEIKRAAAEVERLRARDVVQATIKRESQQQEADAAAYKIATSARADQEANERQADAAAYKAAAHARAQQEAKKLLADASAYEASASSIAQKEANRVAADSAAYQASKAARSKQHTDMIQAETSSYQLAKATRAKTDAAKVESDASVYTRRIDTDADCYATKQVAEARMIQQMKQARANSALADSYADLAKAFGGPAGLLQFIMIQKGTYVELAKANGHAIRGMQPKITVWNTGSSSSNERGAGDGDAASAIRNIYQMLPPLMTTIKEQTGITLPEWQFGRIDAGVQAMKEEGTGKENLLTDR